jgi:homoserine kinase type II
VAGLVPKPDAIAKEETADMAHYTPIDQNDLAAILSAYALGLPLDVISPLDGGKANSSYLLTTDTGSYVISVCDEKRPDELELLTGTLEHLAHHGIATTQLVKSSDGRAFIEHNGKPVYVKHFIEGNVPDSVTPAMVNQLGVSLARLHAVPPQPYLPEYFSYGIESFTEIAAESGSFAGWLQEKTQRLSTCIDEKLPKGLIHGDLFIDNSIFQDEELVAILDFEEVCNYYLVFDLGMCAAGCCCPSGSLSLPLTGALVAGYQSVRPLCSLEKELFKLHIEYAATATAFWRYRQFNIRFPNIGSDSLYREMSSLADQVAALSRDNFISEVFQRAS